jgi:hypothetical protein
MREASAHGVRTGGAAATLATVMLVFGCAADQVRYAPAGALPPMTAEPSAVLFLVGDAGEANPQREAVLAHLHQSVDSVARGGQGPPVVVVFLGDNIYEEGVPEEPSSEDLRKLSGQVLAIPPLPNVRAVFIPGNHDWGNGAAHQRGLAAVARQREWVTTMASGRAIDFLPADGCAGPVTEDLAGVASLVFIDTEWLLRGRSDPACGTPGDFYVRLADTLRARAGRPTILLSHHPVASGGPHGGNVSLFESPPIVYYLVAKAGAIRQDLGSRAYSAMRSEIASAITASGAPPLVHAAGHEHTLQVIRMAGDGDPRYQLVSGSASRSSPVGRVDGTRYATDSHGYMRLDFYAGGTRLIVYAREPRTDAGLRAVFACTLTRAAPESECPEAPLASAR